MVLLYRVVHHLLFGIDCCRPCPSAPYSESLHLHLSLSLSLSLCLSLGCCFCQGMTPSRRTSRALRKAQEEFRRDQRRWVHEARRAQSAEVLVLLHPSVADESGSRLNSLLFSLQSEAFAGKTEAPLRHRIAGCGRRSSGEQNRCTWCFKPTHGSASALGFLMMPKIRRSSCHFVHTDTLHVVYI